MYDVFISHVEEDGALALELALELEKAGYRTWCYEVDSIPGLEVPTQWGKALGRSKCLLLIISREACAATGKNVDTEVWQAHQLNKAFMPVLLNVAPDEWLSLKPAWSVVAATGAVRLTATGAAGALPSIGKGLNALDIQPGTQASMERLHALGEKLQEITGRSLPPVPARPTIWERLLALMRRWFVPPAVFAKALLGAIAAVMILLAVWTVVARVTGPVVVAVMEFKAPDLSHDDEYVRWTTRNLLNVTLSKIGSKDVLAFSKEEIDPQLKPGITEMDVVEKLGTHKMITGEISRHDSKLLLDIHVVDIRSSWLERLFRPPGTLDADFPCEGSEGNLIELQNECAKRVLAALHIALTAEKENELFAGRTNSTLAGYKRASDVIDAFAVEEKAEPIKAKSGMLGPASPDRPVGLAWCIAAAYAQDPEKARIKELLRLYQEALEARDVEKLRPLHVEINDRQKDSLEHYFANARGLHVKIALSDSDIAIDDGEAFATFTRTDNFTEVGTDKPVQLEVRMTSVLTKQDGQWKIRGLKKPS